MNTRLCKYPRTQHIAGSGIQQGDQDLPAVPVHALLGQFLVVEEKVDGANSAISFCGDGRLQLQSRGHYLTGGEREQQFHLFKTWAHRYTLPLWEALSDRYVLYGEWLYARHTIFYTDLPHYFLEFAILDRQSETFLDTRGRQQFLRQLPFLLSVKVLYEGTIQNIQTLRSLHGPSHFIRQNQRQRLLEVCAARGLDSTRLLTESDTSGLMEGLYINVEAEGVVQARYKYVRAGFVQAVLDSEDHWMNRPILPNLLAPGCTLF
jgi:hypothetical protein